MPSTTDILNSIQAARSGASLSELLTKHPEIARRTAQRILANLVNQKWGRIYL
jgi:DNA-binding IclR family transcriptional regulator